ncbi:MAG: peptidoglycan DD-metalloendopeptidase family protein, partial [Candidatus Aminicenantes bacterium]|nr:peptidoglycan DD-metalloendopeptidase family protein [Candidatus Aminicenantes bacterium]
MSVVTPEWLGDGPFALPHDAASWGNFGQRRLNNDVLQSLHAGLDLRVPFGEAIRASNAGAVAVASNLYMGGKTVIIDHGLGVFSPYGHRSTLLVKRGETVKAYVVLKEGQTATAEEITAFCAEQLAPFKVPRRIEFRSELPKTQVGKVLRRVLIEEETHAKPPGPG